VRSRGRFGLGLRPIAALSGVLPTMFMTRVRSSARTEKAISAVTFGGVFGEEVCRSHAGLHRTERMLDRLATQAPGILHQSATASSRACNSAGRLL
jgi:hypothetical protein